MSVQVPNGVVDVLVADEKEAVEVARRYLSYFQGTCATWTCADQELLRDVVPDGPPPRLRRPARRSTCWPTRARSSSCGRAFAPGMVTALVRARGPAGRRRSPTTRCTWRGPSTPRRRQGGPLHAAVRRLRPAAPVPVRHARVHGRARGRGDGAGAPRQPHVRHGRQPDGALRRVVLRKGYGLGAQAMAGGSFRRPLFTVAWPTGELGGMGLEGAVRLGYRRELDAIADPDEREAAFAAMVARAYEHGKALQRGGALRDRRRHRPGADPGPLRPRARRRRGPVRTGRRRPGGGDPSWTRGERGRSRPRDRSPPRRR